MCPGQHGPGGSPVCWEKYIALAYSKNLAAYSHWIGGTGVKGGERAANYQLCCHLTETETTPECNTALQRLWNREPKGVRDA